MTDTPHTTQRVDKWLWYARIVKTRTLGAKLVSGGKVRLNKQRISKPSHVVKPGDTLTFMLHERLRVLNIVNCGARRGPASEAQALYDDLNPELERKLEKSRNSQVAARLPGSGRPTKKERRDLNKLRDAQ
ncbi:MAG: RNA-binding S4 domain-containing protein [Hyphomicrobiales bacterium]